MLPRATSYAQIAFAIPYEAVISCTVADYRSVQQV